MIMNTALIQMHLGWITEMKIENLLHLLHFLILFSMDAQSVACYENILSVKFDKYMSMENRKLSVSFFSLASSSTVICAGVCMKSNDCQSFFFDSISRNCIFSPERKVGRSSTVVENGWSYFVSSNSCKDIFIGGNTKNGTYQIYNRKNQAYFVYCEFHNNYGYTYVSRTTKVGINIDDLYSTREHAKIRIQKNDRTQAETTVENLARYKTQYPLTFFYNKNNGFATPINHAALGPYLYLGFLPVSAANHVQPQGYRAGGRDFPFNNCDRNPNSYIAFFFDTNSHKEVAYSNTDYPLMHGWINVARDIPTLSDMPDEFYFLYEMHMGGCGGYAVAHQHDNLLGAALGFRFDVKDPCENNPCQNGGTCFSVTETSYDCECTQGHVGKRCEFVRTTPGVGAIG